MPTLKMIQHVFLHEELSKKMIDVNETLRTLAPTRPVFHSEADFQHALAWHIHNRYPKLKVRLEYRPARIDRKIYIDIWLQHDEDLYAIELKYKTRRLSTSVHGESFDLLDQSAQDCARYDVCKDVSRVESLSPSYPGITGCVVFLTNDPGYWRRSSRDGTTDADFRLHEGAELSGTLSWKDHASPGTTKGRDDPITLSRKYAVRWMDYSNVGGSSGRFRYLILATRSS